jgi:hypothetical protein
MPELTLLENKDVNPGDIIVYFKGENAALPSHFAIVTERDDRHVRVIHPRSKEDQPSKQLIKGDGIEKSCIHLPYKGQQKVSGNKKKKTGQTGQASKHYKVFRYVGRPNQKPQQVQLLIREVVAILERWNKAQLNFHHKSVERRKRVVLEGEPSIEQAQQTFREQGLFTLIRFAARDQLYGLPAQPSNGLDCMSMAILAYQIAELKVSKSLLSKQQVEAKYGSIKHVSDKHCDQGILQQLESNNNTWQQQQYIDYRQLRYTGAKQRSQKGWLPSCCFFSNNNVHPDVIPLDHKTVGPATFYHYLLESASWFLVGNYKPEIRPYHNSKKAGEIAALKLKQAHAIAARIGCGSQG